MVQMIAAVHRNGAANGSVIPTVSSSETTLLVDIVKKILRVQPVPADQVGGLIAGISQTLAALRDGPIDRSVDHTGVGPSGGAAGRAKRGHAVLRRATTPTARHLSAPAAAEMRGPTAAAASPAKSLPLIEPARPTAAVAEPATYPTITRLPTRGRGRPRSRGGLATGEETNGRPRTTVAAEKPPESDSAAIEPVVQSEPQLPRLLRRSEIESPTPVMGSSLRPTTAAEDVVHRGIVRWFDPKKQLGALRLAGLAEGVSIDSEVLRKAGIIRLYKGQEIEARVRVDGTLVELLSLSLAGSAVTNSERAESLFGPRRQSQAPLVEMKRDALRKTAARLEAEQLFSRGMRVSQSGTSEK